MQFVLHFSLVSKQLQKAPESTGWGSEETLHWKQSDNWEVQME